MGEMPHDAAQQIILPEANPMQEMMLSIAALDQISRCARSIALIKVPRYRKGKHEGTGTGTGWLIAPGLVLTCWHVVAALTYMGEPPPTSADFQLQIRHMLLFFNHREETGKGGIQYKVKRLEYPRTQIDQQDFVFLRLEDRSDRPYKQLGYLEIEPDIPFTKQTQLSIIQHPRGQAQQLANGSFSDFSPGGAERILYTTPTERGTSGSPVLSPYNWHAVALHNAENQKRQLREGTTVKYILNELERKRPDLYSEISNAQHALDNPLTSVLRPDPPGLPLPPSSTIPRSSALLSTSVKPGAYSSIKKRGNGSSPSLVRKNRYTLLSTYKGSAEVLCLAFHPAGRFLASAESNGTIVFWERTTTEPGARLENYTNATSSIAFSPDGSRLASGGDDGTIALWDFQQRKREKTFQGHTEWVSCLLFSSDGQYLISGSDDRSIRVSEVSHGTIVSSIKESSGIFSLAFNPRTSLLASCVSGQRVKLWSTFPLKLLPFNEILVGICCLAFSSDGRYLAAGDHTGTITVYDTVAWKVVCIFGQHTGKVRCLAFHPENSLLASGGDDQVIRLWDVSAGTHLQKLEGHTDHIKSLAFSLEGQLASGGKDTTIMLWKCV